MIGDQEAVKCTIKKIQKHFEITHVEGIHEFIGCKVEQDKDQLLLSQPDLIKKLEEKFGDEVKNLKTNDTPAGPGTHVMQSTSEEEKLDYKM